MKKSILTISILVVAMAIMSCATSIPIKMMKPSEINMVGIKKIAVLPFGFAGEAKSADPLQAAFNRYYSNYSYRSNLEQQVSALLTDGVNNALMNSNAFSIISSSEVGRKVRAGENPSSVVDGYIIGEISFLTMNYKDRYENVKGSDGVVRSTYVVEKTASIVYTVKVYRAADGVLMGMTNQAKETKSTAYGDKAYSSVSSDYEMAKILVNDTISYVAKAIAPYEVTEYRTLLADDTKNANMKEADELVKKGKYADALVMFKKVYAETEMFAAGYNTALLIEINGDLKGAIVAMEALFEKSNDSRASSEVTRMKKTLADEERLQATK